MQAAPIISHAPNREDVVLWRALHAIGTGRYIEIGGGHPSEGSSTRVFADHGWSGLALVSEAAVADARRRERPNELVELVELLEDGQVTVDLERAWQPAGDVGGDLHLLVVHARGQAGPAVPRELRLVDLRPWVVVVSTFSTDVPVDVVQPGSWDEDVLAAGYEGCLFDGVSRFYVAAERSELQPALSYPACVRDAFTDSREAELVDEVAELESAVQAARDHSLEELLRWRYAAVNTWAHATVTRAGDPGGATEYRKLQVALAAAQRDAAEVRQTLSWRVTRPLRMVKSAGRHR